jgi:DNA repair protein RadA/Sms
MPKSLVEFYCSGCGYESAKWLGRCPACDAWNSLCETPRAPKAAAKRISRSAPSVLASAVRLADVDALAVERIKTGIVDLDEVLGGGLVPGSITLLAGTPGVGKSTLALRILDALAAGTTVLYCCAEESSAQTKMRAARVGASDRILIVATTEVAQILAAAAQIGPALLVIDSIQSVATADAEGGPGSVTQVRECALAFTRYAKESGCAVILVGHVTKDGAIAGPKVLEHLVDTVLYFEGERLGAHRVLRATKHRFGATDEVCIFSMADGGLRDVRDPSNVFLGERPAGAVGSVVVATMQGMRPLLVEVQALVSAAGYGTPRRLVSGLDYNRTCMIVAVLERRLGMRLSDQDVYASVVGGIRVSEPAADVAVALAIASAFRDRPAGDDIVCFGEIGLSGEVRSVAGAERRLTEAAKLGFRRAIVPASGLRKSPFGDLRCIPVTALSQAIAAALD